MTHRKRPFVLSIEGNIGVGKSTLLDYLKEHLPLTIGQEPCEQWQQVGKGNLLDHFYQDPQRWAYTFQTYALLTRIQLQKSVIASAQTPFCVFERSVYSDHFCFAQTAFELGSMKPLEWNLYQKLFNWLTTREQIPLDAIVYLRLSPEGCHKRIQQRARSEEQSISHDYLQRIHQHHETWLLDHHAKQIPLLIINIDERAPQAGELARQTELIKEFLTLQTAAVYTQNVSTDNKPLVSS